MLFIKSIFSKLNAIKFYRNANVYFKKRKIRFYEKRAEALYLKGKHKEALKDMQIAKTLGSKTAQLFILKHFSSLNNPNKKPIEGGQKNNKTLSENNSSQRSDNLELWASITESYLNEQKSLSDLLIEKEIKDIKYFDLLQTFEWLFKRLKILIRDNHTCLNCGERSELNHVHHTYYVKGQLPWIIKDEALQTLCSDCHRKLHSEHSIPVVEVKNNKIIEVSREFHSCNRCGGIGYFDIYKHVQNGVCFKCWGDSLNTTVFSSILKIKLENLNHYGEYTKRYEYKQYLKNISDKEFFKFIPDPDIYKPTPVSIPKKVDEEDLPF